MSTAAATQLASVWKSIPDKRKWVQPTMMIIMILLIMLPVHRWTVIRWRLFSIDAQYVRFVLVQNPIIVLMVLRMDMFPDDDQEDFEVTDEF